MLTPAQVAALPDAIVAVVHALDTSLAVQGAKYAVDLYADRARLVALGSGFQREVADTVATAVRTAVKDATAAPEALYAAAETAGKLGPYAPLADSVAVRAIVGVAVTRAQAEARAIVSRAVEARAGNVWASIEAASVRAASGAITREEAVLQAVRAIGEQATAFTYGGRVVELESAVRQSIGTLCHRTAVDAMASRMGEVGVEQVYVSQHFGARPEHAVWQGQVYGYPDELEEMTGYPSDDLGLAGINCRHSFTAYIDGVSPEPPATIDEDANAAVYAATQEQRRIERTLRGYKRREAVSAEAARLAPDNPLLAKQHAKDRDLVATWNRRAADNAKAFDLTRRRASENPIVK